MGSPEVLPLHPNLGRLHSTTGRSRRFVVFGKACQYPVSVFTADLDALSSDLAHRSGSEGSRRETLNPREALDALSRSLPTFAIAAPEFGTFERRQRSSRISIEAHVISVDWYSV